MPHLIPGFGTGTEWSEWIPLYPTSELKDIPQTSGLYRIRHVHTGGISLIGRSKENLRQRVQHLGYGIESDEKPGYAPHTAAPVLWRIREKLGEGYQVSWCQVDEEEVDSLWAAYIARYHSVTGESPVANFGTGNLAVNRSSPQKPWNTNSESESLEQSVFDWRHWADQTSRNWMGLDWSEDYSWGDFIDPFPSTPGVYRIRDPESENIIEIKAVKNIHKSLSENIGAKPSNSLVSFCRLENTNRSTRSEIETVLAGVQYLASRGTSTIDIPETEGMEEIKEKVRDLIARREDDRVELKEPDVESEDVAKEAVAFANSDGGNLIIGAEDETGDVVGVGNIDSFEEDITNKVNGRVSPTLPLKTRKVPLEEGDILWLEISQVGNSLYNCNGTFYTRSGSRLVKLSWNNIVEHLQENPSIITDALQEK